MRSRNLRVAASALFLTLLWAPAVLAQTTTTTLHLAGPVATVSEFREFPESIDRQLLQTWTFSPNGVAQERVGFAYNFMDGSLRSRQVTTYDERGMPLVTVVLGPDDEPLGQTVFRYDAEGRLAEQATYDGEGVETRRVVYERDSAGNVAVQEYWVNGALDRRYERDFDSDGKLLEERKLEEGRVTEVETYTEPGRVAEIVQYDAAGEVEATGTLVEGEHGTEEWLFFDAEGNSTGGFMWTYGDDGLVRERRELDSEGQEIVYTYEYEFDAQGNWILQEVYETMSGSTSLYEVRDREITYH